MNKVKVVMDGFLFLCYQPLFMSEKADRRAYYDIKNSCTGKGTLNVAQSVLL